MSLKKKPFLVDARVTIQRRARDDVVFARALRKEADELLRNGESDAADLMERMSAAKPKKIPRRRQ